MESSFTDEEKRFVLSEIIRQSSLDLDLVVDLITNNNVEPDWLSMHMPRGRTVNECIQATNDLYRSATRRANLKRKSLSELQQPSPKRLAIAGSVEASPQVQRQPATFSHASPHLGPVPGMAPPPQPAIPSPHLVQIQPRPPAPATAGQADVMSQAIKPTDTGTGARQSNTPQMPLPPATRRGRPKARQLRPLLPQDLAPLAPRLHEAPITKSTGSESAVAGGSAPETPTDANTSSAAACQAVSTPQTASPAGAEGPHPARKRGRPRLSDKAKPSRIEWPRPVASHGPTAPAAAKSESPPRLHVSLPPAAAGSRRSNTPETPSSSLSRSPQKDAAFTSMKQVHQEGLAR